MRNIEVIPLLQTKLKDIMTQKVAVGKTLEKVSESSALSEPAILL